jgi:hypothetical protein
LKDISDRILRLIQRGRKVFIRYAPEVSVWAQAPKKQTTGKKASRKE